MVLSDLLLERSHWEGFHDGLRWLRLDLGLLAKHHFHACLRGWLVACLDAADSRQREDASLLHFTSFVSLQCKGRAARLVITPEQAFCFKPCSVAMAFVNAPFVIAFALAFMDFIGGSMMHKRW
jgi:hypothetical protein